MNMFAANVRRRAFTMIELLVVIAIIAILVSLLLPAFSRSRSAAKTAAGLSNLRQISVAISLYAADNRGVFPEGWIQGVTDWSFLIGPYLANNTTNYAVGQQNSPVFMDPNGLPQGRLQYAAHSWLMPWYPGQAFYPIVRALRPAEEILIMDSCQDPDGNPAYCAHATADAIYSILSQPYHSTDADNDAPLSTYQGGWGVGPNKDATGSGGYIRWRQRNNNAADFLFIDGHVESRTPEQVLMKNLRVEQVGQ